ncbi:MAG TPA: MauE/DoxX family redox-associated membrane protein [Candidatus Acidoferrales bacterium]|nr:MauE/DoxX family redox-associated membrane protein [Candidatus Acidoferrales bacterium]
MSTAAVSTPGNAMRRARVIVLIARLALAAVFVYAAIAKLRQPWQLFTMTIDSYQMHLPVSVVNLLAQTLPWFELALGVALFIGWKLRWFASAAAVLLATFFSVMLRAYYLGLTIDCGCFGPGEHLGVKTLLRDGSLFAFSAALAWAAFRMRRREMAAQS